MSAIVFFVLLAKIAIVVAMCVAAGVDISRRIIPNETVLAVAAGGLLIRLLSPQDSPVLLSIAVALIVLVSLGLLGRGAFLGGGDIKMISAATLTEPLRVSRHGIQMARWQYSMASFRITSGRAGGQSER